MEIVAFDTETTGAYPLQAEVCEVAAVRWRDGQIIDQFQSLVKPKQVMSDFIIGIHGITNEMVASAPAMSEVLPKFKEYVGSSILVGHHSAFDIGFLAFDFERLGISFPKGKVLCSSLLSRVLIPETPNHKLQTLVQHFGIDGGTAHRALDDAKACLHVTLKCFERLPTGDTLSLAFEKMGGAFLWEQFSIDQLRNQDRTHIIVEAIQKGAECEIQYGRPVEQNWRRVRPEGIVRGPQADYFVVRDHQTGLYKRFFLNKLQGARSA